MPRKYDIAHLQQVLLTEHRVKRAYERAIDDFARIYDWMEQPQSEDEILEFDKQPILRPQLQKIMNRLQKGVNVAVVDGIKAGWNLAQEKNNDLTRKVFGRAKGKKLTEEQIRAFFTRNEDGLRAFLSRKTQGLSLSERVWKLTAPFKQEMEMAIELAMREGRSADQMSRDVREYLKHPDMLFRRIKGKNGLLKLSKRAAAYHPGRGVYRSSYKNARRLAATEGNIAYRTADHERWQTLDFVVGFEVRLSNNHTCLNDQGKAVRFHDMCDDLQGKYPKQFKFTGWHPHCRCFAIPILKTEEEMARDTERILEGEEPLPDSKNAVQEMPEAFTTWIDNNAARIAAAHEKVALGERASIPFFLKDNFKEGKPENGYIWHEEKKELSILEKAKLRHDARTEEEKQAILDRLAERNKYHQEVKDAATASLTKAGEYSEVDTTALQEALKSGQIARIKAATEEVEKAVKKVVEEEEKLGTLIPNVHGWKQQFTTDELKAVHTAVESKLATFEHLTLEQQKAKLEFEVKWMEDTKKYSTWEVAQSAYKKRLNEVQEQVKWQQVNAQITALSSYSTKSPIFKAALEEAITAQKAGDMEAAKAAIKKAEDKKAELEKKKPQRSSTVESFEELKKRLGDKMPNTLKNLDKAQEKYEQNPYLYGTATKAHKEEIESIIREVLDKNDYGMHIRLDVVDKVLDTHFKNTFETGSSGGYVGSRATTGKISVTHGRLKVAHELFGISDQAELRSKQLKRKEYEKYGCLLDSDIQRSLSNRHGAEFYGEIEVRFKKDKVLPTWTAGDSLGQRWQPSLCSDPKAHSYNSFENIPLRSNSDTSDWNTFRDKHIQTYLELQYHGDLTADCVESVSFPYDLDDAGKSGARAIALRWKAKGAKVFYLNKQKELTRL